MHQDYFILACLKVLLKEAITCTLQNKQQTTMWCNIAQSDLIKGLFRL